MGRDSHFTGKDFTTRIVKGQVVADEMTMEKCSNFQPPSSDWKVLATRWLANQGVSTVLLVAILATMGYMGNYAMVTAIPSHLKQIQDGYIEHAAAHSKEVQAITVAFEKSLKQIADSFDKEMDIVREKKTSGGA